MKKGISLVALVITIIVLVILTATVILTTFNNGILGRSEEAVFKSDIQSFQEELTMYIMNKKAQFEYSEVNVIYNNNEDEHYNNMKEYIKSFSKKYASKLQIVKDKIEYIGTDDQEKQWVSGVGITVNNVEVVGDISDWKYIESSEEIIITGYTGTQTENLEVPNILMINGEKKAVSIIQLENTPELTGTLTVASNVLIRRLPSSHMTNVNKIIIKNNVDIQGVGSWANFEGYLEEIRIGNNCTMKPGSFFGNVPENKIENVILGDYNIIEDGNGFLYQTTIMGDLIIGEHCNLGFSTLTSAIILGNVVIGDNTAMNGAFCATAGVKSIKIGNNCVLGDSEFFQCETLKKVEVTNKKTSVNDKEFRFLPLPAEKNENIDKICGRFSVFHKMHPFDIAVFDIRHIDLPKRKFPSTSGKRADHITGIFQKLAEAHNIPIILLDEFCNLDIAEKVSTNQFRRLLCDLGHDFEWDEHMYSIQLKPTSYSNALQKSVENLIVISRQAFQDTQFDLAVFQQDKRVAEFEVRSYVEDDISSENNK